MATGRRWGGGLGALAVALWLAGCGSTPAPDDDTPQAPSQSQDGGTPTDTDGGPGSGPDSGTGGGTGGGGGGTADGGAPDAGPGGVADGGVPDGGMADGGTGTTDGGVGGTGGRLGFVAQFGSQGRLTPEGAASGPDGRLVVWGEALHRDALGETDDGEVPDGDRRVQVVSHYGADGSHRWTRELPEGARVGGAALAADRILVTGGYTGAPDFGRGALPAAAGDRGVYLLALTRDGDVVWSRGWVVQPGEGDPLDTRAFATRLVADAAGRPVLLGTFRGRLDLGGGPLSEERQHTFGDPAFVARFTRDGALVWARSLRVAVSVRALAVREDGQVAIGGTAFPDADVGEGEGEGWGNAGNEPYVAGLDAATGRVRWRHVFPGVQGVVSGVERTAGGFAFAGSYTGGGFDFAGTRLGDTAGRGSDLVLGAVGPGGEPRWARGYGGEAGEEGPQLVSDAAGRLSLSVRSTGRVNLGGETLEAPSGLEAPNQAFLARYDAEGRHVWSRQVPNFTGTETAIHFLAAQPDGAVVMVTFVADTVAFEGRTFSSREERPDLLLLQFGR
jgi:hypothetical protein